MKRKHLKSLSFIYIQLFLCLCFVQAQKIDDAAIDAKTRLEVVEKAIKLLNENYVFPKAAKEIDLSLQNKLKQGEYDNLSNPREFSQKLTEDLRIISNDKHLRISYSVRPIPESKDQNQPTAEQLESQRRFSKRVNHGFERVERLQGNIGYIDLRGFYSPETGAETVAAAMDFVADTDALIIDLRSNGGGRSGMVALLASYFFGNQPVHLYDIYDRLENLNQKQTTIPAVSGKRYQGKDVFILTSKQTFSAAEAFAYSLQTLKRATIVGEITEGGANPGGDFRINEHFRIFIPQGHVVNPITKTNWEGVGVKPDVVVSSDLAQRTAYLLALTKLFEKSKDEDVKPVLKALIEQMQREIEVMKKM